MDVIEKFNNRKPNGKKNSYADSSVRAYMQFFGLSQSIGITTEDLAFLEYTKALHSQILSNATYNSFFRSDDSKRFLAHLIMHHFYVIDMNWFKAESFLHGSFNTELGANLEYLSGFTFAAGIYLKSCQLNHSCQPNVARIFIGNKMVGKVIRPIMRGEQLFVSYL